MLFLRIAGILILLPGLFFLWLALQSRNPKNLITVPGELTEYRGFKNAKKRNYTVKNMTDFCYTYEVNGKRFCYRGTQDAHPRKVSKRVSIVCLRAFPKAAYIEHFTATTEWALAISLILLGIFCIIVSFVV